MTGADATGPVPAGTPPGAGPGDRWSSALSISADLLRAVNRDATVPDLLALAARHACRLLGTEYAAVFQVAEGDRLVVGGSHGLSDRYVDLVNNAAPLTLSVRSFRTPSTSAVLGGHVIALADALADPDSAQWADLAKMQGYRALLAAPMHGLGGVALGSITAYDRSVREFTPEDVRLIELLAEHTAGALEACRRRDAQDRDAQQLRRRMSGATTELERRSRLLRLHIDLCDAVLGSRGVAGIVEAVAEAVDGTAALWDTGLRASAWAGRARDDADPVLQRLRSAAEAEQATEPGGGPGRPGAGSGDPPVWVAPVSVHDHLRGWLTATGPGVELLSAADPAGITLPVALELQATQHQVEIEARIASDLLTELLADTAEGRAPVLHSRAEALGHDLRSAHFAALLSPAPPAVGRRPERIPQARDISRLTPRFSHMSPRPLMGIIEGKLLALVPERAGDPSAQSSARPVEGDAAALALLTEAAAALYPDRRVHVLVKRGILGMSGYRSSYLLLARAAELLTEHSPEVVDIDDFGLYGVMLDSGPGAALVDFSRRLLAPLADPTTAGRSPLMHTLETWLASGTSVHECSKRMYLHRNTVAYRLRRIEEVLGVDLSKPDDVLRIQLAMVVATVSGWLAAP